MNILNYLEQEKRNIDEFPFNEIDALILSQLSYMITDMDAPFKIEDIKAEEVNFPEGFLSREDNMQFINLTINNPRYNYMEIVNFLIIENPDLPEYLKAYNIKIDDEIYFVGVGGTGTELEDWKEDFEMSYNFPVSSQIDALGFLKKEMESLSGNFYAGGHSKGGNIVEYAAMNIDKDLQDRLIKVYSFDGPGFINSVYGTENYLNIRDKVRKFIPTDSKIGTLFENDNRSIVIQSKGIGVRQHNPYLFQHDGENFIRGEFSKSTKRMNDAFNTWVKDRSDEERKDFTEAFFYLMEEAGIESSDDLSKNFLDNFRKLLNIYLNMDSEKKEPIEDALRTIPKIWLALSIRGDR